MELAKVFVFLAAAAVFSGCFAHREAPERQVTARGLDAALAESARVERVDLSGARRADVPAELAGMPRLKTLYLAGGGFTNFAALASLKGLEVLDLSRVKLGAGAPAELASLPALRDLYLSGCGLSAFPEAAASLPALRYLNLDRNQIAALPDALPAGLRWLRLNHNALEALPDAVGKLERLERIYLRGNKLTTLPDALADCVQLEDVELADNDLESFPAFLCALPRLRNLDLTGNRRVETLPDDDALHLMKSLRTLALTGCPLSSNERARVRAALPDNCAIIF